MSFLLLLALGFFLFMGIPAIIFAIIDDWRYTTSLYFVAVTLTTVGFGDVLPTGPRDTFERGMYVVAVVGWLFVGLTFASVVFTKVTQFYEKADSAIATRMASGMAKKRRFHPCGCFRGQDCTATVKAVEPQADDKCLEPQTDNATNESTTELELEMKINDVKDGVEADTMKINDVEDSVVTSL